MRESSERTQVVLTVTNPLTGDTFGVTGESETRNRYYTIKNLNFKGAIMDLFTYQSQICKSSKDIEIFRDLLFSVNRYNEFRENVVKFAKEHDTSQQRVSKMLTEAVAVGLMRRIERGVYLVNPFAFKSKGSDSETIERLQREWITSPSQ
jgi:hypothetical protein